MQHSRVLGGGRESDMTPGIRLGKGQVLMLFPPFHFLLYKNLAAICCTLRQAWSVVKWPSLCWYCFNSWQGTVKGFPPFWWVFFNRECESPWYSTAQSTPYSGKWTKKPLWNSCLWLIMQHAHDLSTSCSLITSKTISFSWSSTCIPGTAFTSATGCNSTLSPPPPHLNISWALGLLSQEKDHHQTEGVFYVLFTHLSSAHWRNRCWALGEWHENLSMARKCCFSGDSRLRSCSNSCSYITLWRSKADRFSSSCCCSRLCKIDCMGSRRRKGEIWRGGEWKCRKTDCKRFNSWSKMFDKTNHWLLPPYINGFLNCVLGVS